MIVCPDCGFENIEGADLCEGCGQPLTSLSLRVPNSSVEADLLRDSIEKLQPRKPLTVAPDTPIGDVLRQLVDNRIGCIVVVDGDKVLGIFSERDVLMRIGVDAANVKDRPVAEFMTPDPVTLEAKNRIAFAIQRMNLGGYRHIPILKGGKLAGVISVRDILSYFTERIAATQQAK
jgi:CBS domain-containing protein